MAIYDNIWVWFYFFSVFGSHLGLLLFLRGLGTTSIEYPELEEDVLLSSSYNFSRQTKLFSALRDSL